MDLSIIIVNYNSADHVLNCINSIQSSHMKIEYELIVVDNGSSKNDETQILTRFPEVKWIQTGYNAGFARANNEGIRIAKGQYLLLLNADTLIRENAVEKVFNQFSSQDTYVACGVQLLNSDGTVQHSGAKFIKGGANILLPLPYLGRAIKSVASALGVKQPNVFHVDADQEVDWIVGAFIMTKRKVIAEAGLLDEDFFMYAEEIEWCSRLRKIGPLILYANMNIIHLGGGASSSYYQMKTYDNSMDLWSKKAKQIMVSQFLRVRKQWGLGWFLLHLSIYFAEIPIFILCLAIDKLWNGVYARHTSSHLQGYMRNLFSSIPLFLDILFNKHKFYKIS